MYWDITLRRKQITESYLRRTVKVCMYVFLLSLSLLFLRSTVNLKTKILKGMLSQKLFKNRYQALFKRLAEIQCQNIKISGQA